MPVLFPLHLLTLAELSQREALGALQDFSSSKLTSKAARPTSALLARLLSVKRAGGNVRA
jgi:hypothetical protein